MTRKTKLLILLLLSLSVFIIYQETSHSMYQMTSIGDGLSLGINSYGSKDYGYIDYVEEELKKQNDKVVTNTDYSKKDQSLKSITTLIKQTPKIKKILSESDLLIITLGYNDLLYSLSIEESLTEQKFEKIMVEIKRNYEECIEEITKYYHNSIIVVGYCETNSTEKYKRKGILELNKILKENQKITYIDTQNLLKRDPNFFSNPNSYYPNRLGYYEISRKIIQKTLENQENI